MEANNYGGTLQKPINSGFNANTTASEVMEKVNLTGKIAIVTGGNSGIGLETTKWLASAGATVIVPARNIEKAKKNLKNIPRIEIQEMDIMNPQSIAAFTQTFLASNRPLHLLINNAGIMWVPLRRVYNGIESQLATNFLGPFQLTAQLFPALQKAKGARVINVSSQGHQFSPFHDKDPNYINRKYETLEAYGQSKTALNLFTVALDHKAKKHHIRAFSLHPGAIAGTELGREASLDLWIQMGLCDTKGNILPEVAATLKTIPQGATTTLWCATSKSLNNLGGVYCEDVEVAEMANTNEITKGIKPYALDIENAKKVWKIAEELTGIRFPI
ncbi:SDR family NAD(P)-dependent oxidoreductase [Flavobacterium sp. J27]|uniref:SDR family NAD(P)-dependent oxidoreductase n=1 Tax=Flavobacterium sp. J27 TaxID=2060419 RepID=UPI00102FA654|nr:SDR family NAD(P)-dependent oxidoreductase [Flavobacterium sp. J27]